ncbi:AraC-like DNA-binding protein/mannose-6-phosphate isomerase-like protein (cupin superfamily) [Crossiella equi]|uniref:AraC-like DNA-binding protein/mannose-6-phosphate isomerase-like protein (Cupin superfamily) n=1 Tax=Crossiella equi TaxID=130796 RepID=A0ABS5A7R4_9PSEU|nr:AraC family transcriptional regulator [Crossiella equi]MBP2472635.1 AraC-like DNA-binding protein/mannose-6-phosphate isomerase-like protein (cupin superfamily) [Crossiella equi]
MATATLAELRARPGPGPGLHSPQRMDFHLIALVTSGTGTHTVDFVRHDCRPGTLLWVRPGQVQQFARDSDLEASLVFFAPAFPPRLRAADHLLARRGGPVRWQLAGQDLAAITANLAQLGADYARTARGDYPAWTELLRHLLATLLLRIAALPRGGDGEADGGNATFTQFQRELERFFAQTRQVEDYADRLGCSSKTLTRACRAATGQAAKQLIDARVALEAKRLLAYTNLPVANISRRLGFSEPTNFGKFFQREAGQSPSAFRSGLLR